MTSMLEIEYDDSALLESLVEDIREFTDWMEVSEGKGGIQPQKRMGHTLGRRRVWDAALRGHCLELNGLFTCSSARVSFRSDGRRFLCRHSIWPLRHWITLKDFYRGTLQD